MKKFFVSVLKLAIVVVAAIGLLCIGMMQEWRTEVIMAAFFFGGVFIAFFLGFFNCEEKPTMSIKQGARSMRPAA